MLSDDACRVQFCVTVNGSKCLQLVWTSQQPCWHCSQSCWCYICHIKYFGMFETHLSNCMLAFSFYCATHMHSAYMPWQDVCLSVCLSHAGIVPKRLHISPSCSPTILVFLHRTGWRYSMGTPLTRASNARGYDKMTILSQIFCSISQMVIVRWAHAARQFVKIKFSFHPYNI